jgi:uncharacterized protein YktA (UPF0223 family)
MKQYTFHWELRTVLAQFEDAFNDVIIKRHNIDREPKDQIHVNFRLAPKTRVLHDIVNKNQHIKLPCIAVMPGGLARDTNRVFNNIEGSFYTNAKVASAWQQLYQPVPVDLSVSMSIIARNLIDIDQIITNFIPYCDDYIVVSWKWPISVDWTDFEIRSKIKWSGQVNFSYPVELSKSNHYRILADTNFIIKTWMFKNNPNTVGPIYKIEKTFTAVSEFSAYNVMKEWADEYNTDFKVISAIPQFYLCTPPLAYVNQVREIICYGDMYDFTDDIYLSANNLSMFPGASYYSPFHGVSGYVRYDHSSEWPSISTYFQYDSLSGLPLSTVSQITAVTSYYINDLDGWVYQDKELTYPGFTAFYLPTSEWSLVNKNIFTFNVSAQAPGTFDIIAVNGAGYGKMMEDTVRNFPNPYPPSRKQHKTFTPYQHPCISGVKVYNVGV